MSSTLEIQRIDVRTIPPRERHPFIFASYRALPVGGALELVNDHDPRPLQAQFHVQAPGGFSWQYLLAGPDLWQVRVTKTADVSPATGSCCGGGCGGA